ncbi:MAG TPA: zinc ribbon domain-containing protein [Candidatus Flavonifractor merdigallinarum]|uniref:Zinc ribbon domain-containing protein n=1 Tax=Candidatus Flavonifractor merdigallinarum TaxID=2838589 RepID=A0A9D2BWV4_9FIRM|nr:zinc ribbon domain-containing protein [Candidatus Flavonifractor merdigallinarum]
MSIFDQIGKKLSDAGQETATKAKNFAEVTRLNGMVSDLEKQIAKMFQDMGQSYYEHHQNDPNAEEQERITAIQNAYAEIARYQEQIKQIKGVERCPNCGAEVAIGSAFCNACGAKLMAQPQPTGRACPNCHAPVNSGDLFCNACGTRMPDGETQGV